MSFQYKEAPNLEADSRNEDYEDKRTEYIQKMSDLEAKYKQSVLYTEMSI